MTERLEFQAAPATLPPGRRIYAIGDVHGCAARLAVLHDAIAADLARRPCPGALLIHLGDYVDRGPDSAGVVRMLAAGSTRMLATGAPGPVSGLPPTINLMGNHERTMLDALSGQGAACTDWMIGGGREALRSWGADPDAPRDRWAAHVPSADREFLAGLALHHRSGGYLFVHAGIRPGVALADQAAQDLLGIRGSFLHSEADHGMVVVHGHTPKPEPVLRANRIGIDTGAVFGGRLTCAVLEDSRIGFLFAEAAAM